MNNGLNDNSNKDHEYTYSSGPEDSPYDRNNEKYWTEGNGKKEDPGKELPPEERPPVKEPPPAEEPPREIPPREDDPEQMPPPDGPEGEDPIIRVPPREDKGTAEARYMSIAPRGGKEVEYDSRNYTYNIARHTDRSERTGTYTGAGESPSEGPEGSALDQTATRYSGYEVVSRAGLQEIDNGTGSQRGGDEPPRYRVHDNGRPEGRRRSLVGTLAMILIGAVLGTALTLAVVYYFLAGERVFDGIRETSPGTQAPVSTRTLITGPAVDTGETFENRVAEKVIPSVVGITTRQRSQGDPLFGEAPGIMEGMGSGVIVSEDGFIVTNAHVVNNGEAWELKIILADETVVDGEVLWSDAALDLAIVKAEADSLSPAEIGSSGSIRVGDKAIAIGNPLGMNLQSTMTSGYISGLDRSIDLEDGFTMDGLIQTDAAINEGNSGGALLNAAGQLIGINTAKAGGRASGIGFAIPVDTAAPIIARVMAEGSFESVYMGLTGMNLSRIKAVNYSVTYEGNDGVYITEVMPGTAADDAGLEKNDIILAIEGEPVTGMTGMKKILLNYELSDTVEIIYIRNNRQESTLLTFAQDSSTIDQFIPDQETKP